MTLKSLFFNLQKEDLKRRIWTIALYMLVFFLSFPVICALEVGSFTGVDSEQTYNMLLGLLGVTFNFASFLTIVCAIICGLSSFFYLHSKKKVDLFHSLPIRRELMFAVHFVNGFLIFIVPYIINLVACYIILAINKFMSVEILSASLKAIGINSLFFLLIYTIVIIAVMLTGNLVVSSLGSGVFLSYGAMLIALKELYYSQFFTTYSSRYNEGSILEVLSPFYVYADVLNSKTFPIISLIKVMLVTIAFIYFALYLYKKRPSEAAGKAMAFQISKPIIKFLIVVPVALAGGIFFSNISRRGETGWYIFGLLFFAIVVSIIIEMIYNFDVKSAFKKKKEMLIAVATAGFIASIFHFDLIKYDSYIPEKSELASMSIAIDSLDGNLNTYNYSYNYNGYGYISYIEHQLNTMELKDMEAAYSLAALGVNTKIDTIDYNNILSYTVKYNMKNGKEVYREYITPKVESYDLINKLYSNKEYKEAHFPIYKVEQSYITKIESYDIVNGSRYNISMNDIAEFIQIFKEDLNNITLDDMVIHTPIAMLSIGNERYTTDYYINAKYVNTIAFLKEQGFEASGYINSLDNISKIVAINNNEYIGSDDNNNDVHVEYTKEYAIKETQEKYALETDALSKTYTDKEVMKELLPNLIDSDYYWANNGVIQVVDGLEFIIYFEDANNGDYITKRYYILEDKVPEFVKEDLQYKE